MSGLFRRRSAMARLAGVAAVAVWVGSLNASGTALAEEHRARAASEAPATAMDRAAGLASNSPLLLADPKESRFVVLAHRIDAPDFSCGLQVSGDGGRNWVPAAAISELPAGVEKCYAPEVAFDSSGTLFYLFVGLAGSGNEPVGAFLVKSSDRARTFTKPARVLGPLNFGVRMAIDRNAGGAGRMHLVWLHATSDPPLGGLGPPPNPIMSSYSDNGGKTWSPEVHVSDSGRERVVAPALTIGRRGAVHVAYYDLREDAIDYQGLEGPVWDGKWSLVVASSTDGGKTFSTQSVADDGVVPYERVMLVFTMPPATIVSDGNRRLCVAWADARNGDPDVLARCRVGDGNWSQERRVNDDPLRNGKWQYLPRLSIAPSGRVDAVFYDRRTEPENILNDVFFSYSDDGGITFTPNVRVSRDSFESRIGQRYVGVAAQGMVEFGSRLGLLSTDQGAISAWPDTRNSGVLRGATGQDIFTAEMRVPRKDESSQWFGVGAALVAMVAAGATIKVHNRRRRHEPSRGEATP